MPHRPTRFGKVRVTPHDPELLGYGRSDSLFTIEASIVLLNLQAEPVDVGGVLLTWETDPGPEDLAGYKVERSSVGGSAWQTLASLVRETE